MASELLEFEDDDDVNENSAVGTKRPGSPLYPNSADKRDSLSTA